MLCLVFVLFLGGFFVNEANTLHLPSYIEPCRKDHPNFDACVMEKAKKTIPHLYGGDKKYRIPKLNPLELEAVGLETAGNLTINLSKLKVYGLDTVTVQKIKIDRSKKYLFFDLNVERLEINGKYKMNGKILVLPLQGNGLCNISTADANIKLTIKYDLIKKNGGKTFINLGDNDMELNLKNFHLYFDNLFNGNEELGKNTNKVLNEEWEAVLMEIKPALEKTISTIIVTIAKGVIENIPYDEIFP